MAVPGIQSIERSSMMERRPDRWDLATRVDLTDSGDLLDLQPGRPVELAGPPGFGLTRVGLHMLAAPSEVAPVVVVDVRGWASPKAAWEMGVRPDRLIVVRCGSTVLWPKVTAALFEGVRAVYAEVPTGVGDRDLRRLAALARARRVRVVFRPLAGSLPAGVAHLRLQAHQVIWEGADGGHGRLTGRRLVLEASGKGAAGMTRRIEVEEQGENGMRVVSGLAAGSSGRAIG